MNIIIDCMSGDNAPEEIVKGALDGAAKYGVTPVLVGEEAGHPRRRSKERPDLRRRAYCKRMPDRISPWRTRRAT